MRESTSQRQAVKLSLGPLGYRPRGQAGGWAEEKQIPHPAKSAGIRDDSGVEGCASGRESPEQRTGLKTPPLQRQVTRAGTGLKTRHYNGKRGRRDKPADTRTEKNVAGKWGHESDGWPIRWRWGFCVIAVIGPSSFEAKAALSTPTW